MRSLPLLSCLLGMMTLPVGAVGDASSRRLPSIPDLQVRGMTVLSDEDVLREFPGSTFEVYTEGRGFVLIEHFATNGHRRIVPAPGSPVRAGVGEWRVENGRLCVPASGSPMECGAPVGRIGETFYRLGGGRVLQELRRRPSERREEVDEP